MLIVILIIIVLITLNVKQFVSVVIFINEKLVLLLFLTLLLLLLLIFPIQRNLVFIYFAKCFGRLIGRIVEQRRAAAWAALVIINDHLLFSWIIIYSIFLGIFIIFEIAVILTHHVIINIFIITSFRMLFFLWFLQFTFNTSSTTSASSFSLIVISFFIL